ncbi:MAG TPA: hypothetical protein VHX63_03710 [Acidobacteriaceae bacterium]|jgi:hypothetical protein|nr:hypothetical protein [Acidobacteriaceae bacterium]
MSLRNTNKLFESAAYLPASLQLEFQAQQLWDHLSERSQACIRIAMHKTQPGPPTFREMWGHVWAGDSAITTDFAALSMDEKAEVLGFFTFQIHELTHHFDFLTTPYGANFQGKLFREYLAFQRFAPLFLREVVPHGNRYRERFVDYDPSARDPRPPDASDASHTSLQPDASGAPDAFHPSDAFLAAWKEVHDIVATLEALGDGSMLPHKQNMVAGWGGNNSTIQLFRQPVHPITVRGFFNTVTTADHPDWYLRPSTIFETRAVVHCLMWILKLFGGDERAREPLSIYLDSFYGPTMVGPDYTFVLDVIATGWGSTFSDFVRTAPMPSLRQFLMLTDASCWYALQAPPPMPDASAVRSSPIVRLMHALRFFNDAIADRRAYPTSVAVLMAMDSAQQAAAFELTGIDSILAYSAGFVQYLQQHKLQQVRDPILQKHFDRVLGVQHRRLAERVPHGYISYSGMPEDGHPVRGLRNENEVDDLAFDSYVADQRVRNWFSFRYNFLYRFPDAATIAASLKDFFGDAAPRVSPADPA